MKNRNRPVMREMVSEQYLVSFGVDPANARAFLDACKKVALLDYLREAVAAGRVVEPSSPTTH